MNVKVKFLGAAGTVTGSRFLLEVDKLKILVDCGLFQGLKEYRLRNWDSFPINPAEIDMVFLVHGEEKTTDTLAQLLKEKLDWNPIQPNYLESFELFSGI